MSAGQTPLSKFLKLLIYVNAKVSQHLLKCQFLRFDPKISLDDNAIDKSRYLPCIQHKNQNDMAYGCRTLTRILRQPPFFFKSQSNNTLHF